MDDPTEKIHPDSAEEGPDLDLNVNGGDPLPDPVDDPGEDDPAVGQEPVTEENR